MIELKLDRHTYYHKHMEIGEWCDKHIGPMGEPYGTESNLRWYRKFVFGTQFYYFEREEDASLFALYWL